MPKNLKYRVTIVLNSHRKICYEPRSKKLADNTAKNVANGGCMDEVHPGIWEYYPVHRIKKITVCTVYPVVSDTSSEPISEEIEET